ncbi:hypothetical protein COT97_00985 [Candidatus Falkowbacteria bacterium CG10_big_fil_rev_8_21_14_0_10_39_11]|uniref:Uncharacterized protein n=1 Tax=Candidatus Falkowbacteria bacterium CG10_big_fil_rev_8_21_14_0_10_39_11 TaxID=1974565 RepID=A0A2H0V5X1_9BACT|nr:MAG: hypothetical protein COT97_00985 [Candidatus Falkowbacteria bacterium CG10_big_fil_rev_8_21_14_0_10_39_11]
MRTLNPEEEALLGRMAVEFRITVDKLQSAYGRKYKKIKPKSAFETEARQLVFNSNLGTRLSEDDFSFWTRKLRREVSELDRLAKKRLSEGARQHEASLVRGLPDSDQDEYWREQGKVR